MYRFHVLQAIRAIAKKPLPSEAQRLLLTNQP
jgi:hypothetical protein